MHAMLDQTRTAHATATPACEPRVSSAVVGAVPHSFRLGEIQAVQETFCGPRSILLNATEKAAHLLIPLRGRLVVVGGDDVFDLGPGKALLLAPRSQVVCHGEGVVAIVLRAPRAALEAEAAKTLGRPRQIKRQAGVLDWLDGPGLIKVLSLGSAAEAVGAERAGVARSPRPMLAGLARALDAAALFEASRPIARSVAAAVERIEADPCSPWTIEALAGAVGVTVATLRRNFRTSLGRTITQVVREARLAWVRRSLQSATEARSIGELSVVAGFGAAGLLARAYQMHFGETPSQTRARAFGGE